MPSHQVIVYRVRMGVHVTGDGVVELKDPLSQVIELVTLEVPEHDYVVLEEGQMVKLALARQGYTEVSGTAAPFDLSSWRCRRGT